MIEEDKNLLVTSHALSLIYDGLSGDHGEIVRMIAETGVAITDTLIRKNIDYGASFINPPVLNPRLSAESGVLCRMSDKICRIARLNSSDGSMIDESLDDTITDLAGYAILLLVARAVKNSSRDSGAV